MPDIKRIIKIGNGFITVQMTDGKVQKRVGGTLAWRNNNPGNLKYGDFAKKFGAIGPGWKNHAVFASYDEGRSAQKALLFSNYGRYHKLPLLKAISIYAPEYDGNNPKQYANYIAKKIGTDTNVILNTLTNDQRNKMVDVMGIFEGYKVGKITTP